MNPDDLEHIRLNHQTCARRLDESGEVDTAALLRQAHDDRARLLAHILGLRAYVGALEAKVAELEAKRRRSNRLPADAGRSRREVAGLGSTAFTLR